jgi:lipid-A-disaccharide synthase
MTSRNEVMIVSGEVSGDMHGARVLSAMQKEIPNLQAYGMGGTALRDAGMEILVDAADMAVVGIVEILTHIGSILRAKKTLDTKLKSARPKLLILIDYPEFNLLLAAKAKKLGVPVLFFVSPQIWAWRSYRVHKIRRLVDRMAVILPFEKSFYAKYNFDVDFVGHPLVDHMKLSMDKNEFRHKHAIPQAQHYIGLLPGSRRKEISSMLPLFLETARILQQKNPDTIFLLPLAPSLQLEDLQKNGLNDYGVNIHVVSEDRYELMNCCDLVLAASGTVTLELALLQIPMVVSYCISPLTYQIGSRLINVQYASLVNLIADKEIVPELIQNDATPENISSTLQHLWPGSKAYTDQKNTLSKIKKMLGKGGCENNVAAIAKTFFI